MTTIGQILETCLVVGNGLIAYFYGLWRCTADVLFTTGAQVLDVWRK